MKTIKKKPGPKRLDYIPLPFRGIDGVNQLTTVRQLENLKTYMEMTKTERPPCLRIGASVPQFDEEGKKKPTTTYAVTVDGEISVVKLQRDPRSAHKWFMNARRPWNLSARYASAIGGKS